MQNLSQRRTEPHVSTVNTMTEALDIQMARHSESSPTTKKKGTEKTASQEEGAELNAVAATSTSLFFLRLQSL